MCNSQKLTQAAMIAAVVYTGGAAAGAWGAAGTAASAGAGGAVAESFVAPVVAGGVAPGAGAAAGMSTTQMLALGTSAAGTAMQAVGQMNAAEAAKAAAERNAQMATIMGHDAQDRGDLEQQRIGRQVSAVRGQQTANMAANGLDLTSGTPEAVLAQTDYYGLEDQRTAVNNANREAAGYKNRANGYASEAASYNPYMTAGSTLLAGGGMVADKWDRYKNGGRIQYGAQN
jgi:hypothetical protein